VSHWVVVFTPDDRPCSVYLIDERSANTKPPPALMAHVVKLYGAMAETRWTLGPGLRTEHIYWNDSLDKPKPPLRSVK
jgi:hypothetical protein